MIKLTSISNHIRYKNNLSIIITIKFPLSYSTLPLLSQVLTIRKRRRLELIPTSWGVIPNTKPYFPRRGRVGSPLVQLRYSRGSDQRRTLRDTTSLPGSSGLAYHRLIPLAPHTSLLPLVCALSLTRSRPELSYLAARSERLTGQLSARHAFNMT